MSISIRSKKTSYDILIGKNLLKENNNYLQLTLADKKIAIISDETVHNLQYSNFLDLISYLKVDISRIKRNLAFSNFLFILAG